MTQHCDQLDEILAPTCFSQSENQTCFFFCLHSMFELEHVVASQNEVVSVKEAETKVVVDPVDFQNSPGRRFILVEQ